MEQLLTDQKANITAFQTFLREFTSNPLRNTDFSFITTHLEQLETLYSSLQAIHR